MSDAAYDHDEWIDTLQRELRAMRVQDPAAATPEPAPEPAPEVSADVPAGGSTDARPAEPPRRPVPSGIATEEQLRGVQASISELGRRIETALHEEGAGVWSDMRAFAQELRSRVDDIDEQQRRTLRDLTEWQTQLDERIDELAEVLRIVLRRD